MGRTDSDAAEVTLPAWWTLPPRMAALFMSDEEREDLLLVLMGEEAAVEG